MNRSLITICIAAVLAGACTGGKKSSTEPVAQNEPVGPTFLSDSAFSFCEHQCAFGPRTMNSEAHEQCGQWIARKFEQLGMSVTLQKVDLKGYDGTVLKSTNIIAAYRPEAKQRVMLCAHWDSRPWADNDPDEKNHRQPVMAANDGASGIGVMLEVARLLSSDTLSIGVDFVCFDAEDWGTPQWAEHNGNDGDTWALGAQHWAQQYSAANHADTTIRYGILLDMVGGQGARFYQEGVSLQFAPNVVKKVWQAAETIGYGSLFPKDEGVAITDDHLPVNQVAGIPCIDIIPYYPDCEASSFGPTWHTVNDDMEHLDRNTLQAVGQTIIQVLYSEN